jgi:general secretion pathway protein I
MTELGSGKAVSRCGMAKLRGFTLLEVMIALLVITLGMAAVINTTSESGWKSAQLRHKTIATWVGQNQIVKYRANRIWGDAKSQSGKVEMANIDWEWKMKISGTDDPSLRRLDVEVFIDGEDALKARLTGFIARI